MDVCERCSMDIFVEHAIEDLLCVELVGQSNVWIDQGLKLGAYGDFRLVGVVYYGGAHFVSRILTGDGDVYYHDGIDGPYSTFEGRMGKDLTQESLLVCRGRTPSIALYVKDQ